MKFKLPVDHFLSLPASQSTGRPPQGCFWETTHPIDVRRLWEAFNLPSFRDRKLYKNGEVVGTKKVRDEKSIVARLWVKDVFLVMASILKVPESHIVHAFKTNRHIHLGREDMTAQMVADAWNKSVLVMKKAFDPEKELQAFYAGRRSSGSSEPLSVSLARNYLEAHQQCLKDSEKRVTEAVEAAIESVGPLDNDAFQRAKEANLS